MLESCFKGVGAGGVVGDEGYVERDDAPRKAEEKEGEKGTRRTKVCTVRMESEKYRKEKEE